MSQNPSGRLLPYENALARILLHGKRLQRDVETVDLSGSCPSRVLAEAVAATSGHPRFDNSAVDGYAVHINDLTDVGIPKQIAFAIATGSTGDRALEAGEVARILTGARVPAGTAAIVMQEDVAVAANTITLHGPVEKGANVRTAGSDFAAGEVLLEAGTPITAGVAGLLASQGITRPTVRAVPHAVFITTGDEIVAPDAEPGRGQLRDSIGPMLSLAATPYATSETVACPDDPALLESAVASAAERGDVVFIAGGASVGDRDFTAQVVAKLGIVDFHGINVRPGKPVLFGQVNVKPVIGLPGNPASAFVCFHLFGVPLLRAVGGWSRPGHLWIKMPFGATHEPEPRDVFARVVVTEGRVVPVLEQASFGLRALGAAQALARLPGGSSVARGDEVNVTLL